MAIAEITIAVLAFLVYLVCKSVSRFLVYAYLFLIFIFSYIISDPKFSTFYILLFIGSIALYELTPKLSKNAEPYGKKGIALTILGIIFGLVIYITIAAISKSVGGQIVGVPNLGISSTNEVALLFKPTFESMLGIVENFFVFVIFDILVLFGVFIPLVGRLIEVSYIILPTLITAIFMGFLHIVAYSINFNLILWASLAFALFIISRFYLKDTTSADTAHWLNNLNVAVSRGLSVVG